MKLQINFNVSDIISDDLLEDLRGGTSAVISEEHEKPKEGDGAKWICCIIIKLPQKEQE